MASSFGSPYGNITFKYFQDLRNTATEKSCELLSGGCFPTVFSPNQNLAVAKEIQNWERWRLLPTYTRLSQDSGRASEIHNFYEVSCPPTQAPAWDDLCAQGAGCLLSFRAGGDLVYSRDLQLCLAHPTGHVIGEPSGTSLPLPSASCCLLTLGL